MQANYFVSLLVSKLRQWIVESRLGGRFRFSSVTFTVDSPTSPDKHSSCIYHQHASAHARQNKKPKTFALMAH